VIAKALEKNVCRPENAVMVGDREYDVLGGKANGLKTVGVLYGYGSRKELERVGADRICATVKDLEKELMFCSDVFGRER